MRRASFCLQKSARARSPIAALTLALIALLVSACSGAQSALDPGGIEAARIARLFWVMTIGSAVIWLFVVGLATYALYVAPERTSERLARLLIVGGGVVLPTVVLTALLIHGLAMLPAFLEKAPEGSLRIQVSGEQWWWRVRYVPLGRYLPAGRDPVELANEIRLPMGEAVEFELESPDVIHSFWIPALAGKVDMIPGRKTRLRLTATRAGTYRGVCAEYCGTAHALMAFSVVVQSQQDFARWLEAQAKPAAPAVEARAREGEASFRENGCGACHAIRGTRADGVVGPDLTHVGGRLSLGAGILSNDVLGFHDWITRTDGIKPGVHMPRFGMLADAERRAIATYLDSLQ
jgi:cytochrome c oxidase subunit 2